MSDAWTNAIVVDPEELRQLTAEVTQLRSIVVDPDEMRELTAEVTRLRTVRGRQRLALCAVVAVCAVVASAFYLQSSQLSVKSEEARHFRKSSRRANTALSALARSHDEILAATQDAPSVGTKSWGRRFTVTKYLPKSPAYGKDNDGLTATMAKADPDARIIAVDPKLIPYGSWVWIEGLGWYNAQDCGGAIKGFRLDVLTATADDAMAFGKQDRFVIVVPGERASG